MAILPLVGHGQLVARGLNKNRTRPSGHIESGRRRGGFDQLPLVRETSKTFTVSEVSADKAYASLENFEAVAECGGLAFIAFKSNHTGAVGGTFAKMFHWFKYKQEEYMARYHKRSNVESTFSMVKAKFGDSVRSRTDTAMVNEVLCKFIAHNLCCLVQE
jgi:transposase